MNIIKTERPWGFFMRFTHNEKTTVKIISVNKGGELSVQYHNHRDEFSKILSGNPKVRIGDEIHDAKPGDEFFVNAHTIHQVTAPNDDVTYLEISFGDFDEEDIVRVSDIYNRV
jgi:mannose-6-phosphate isomerase-like protein (cupin superfamily)